MRRTERLWRALESTPVLSGVQATWKEIAGDDLSMLTPFLRPASQLAATYPCPEPGEDGCPRGVVVHASDDIVAVCRRRPRSCESLRLKKEDVVVYTLDIERLASILSALLGLKSDVVAPANGLARTLYLGLYRPVAGLDFPVYLTVQHDREEFAQIVEQVAARDARPFVLMAPTTYLIAPASVELMRTRHALAVGLADFTAVDEVGSLVADRSAEEILKEFRSQMLDVAAAEAKEGMVFFATPPDAKWPDVEIRFKDGHTVSVKVLDTRGVFNYTQMGMANKKNAEPTRQWELLRAFAEGNGILTWNSRHADRKNQKRREQLAKDLRRFFRIDGDPIALTEDGKGWRVLFSLHAEA